MQHRRVRNALTCACLAVTAVGAVPAGAVAPDGSFDALWNGGGHFSFAADAANPATSSRANFLERDGGGRILLGGSLGVSSGYWLGQLLADGTFAPAFGNEAGNGRYVNNVAGQLLDVKAVGDGSYLVLRTPALVRTDLGAHGNVLSVSNGSFAINDVAGQMYYAFSAMPQSDGKFLLAGRGVYSNANLTPHFSVVRLDANGALDLTFNAASDGIATFAGGTVFGIDLADTEENPSRIFVQNDGRILLVGWGTNINTNSSALELARLNSNGSLDTAYGSDGKVQLSWPGHHILDEPQAAIDSAGRMIVAMRDSENSGMIVARVNEAGSPEFFTVIPAAPFMCLSAFATGVALDSAGRILLSGGCHGPSGRDYFLSIRVRGDTGALDTSYGANGGSLGSFDALSQSDVSSAVTMDWTGHPILTGASHPGGLERVGVARLTYELIFVSNFETRPRGCLPPVCS